MPSRLRRDRFPVFSFVGLTLLALMAVMLTACDISSSAPGTTIASSGSGATPTDTSAPGSAPTVPPAPAPTNTPVHVSTATPTPTSPIIICCIRLLPSIHQVFVQQTLAGTSVGPVTATCPSGEVALSGGWATSPSDGSGVTVYNSTRSGTNGWRIFVTHSSSTLVNAYVECLKNASGATVAERYAGALTVPANSYGTKFASCNAGEVLVGGGFASSNGLTLYNFTASGSSWGGYVWNHTSSGAPFSFYAECLTYSGAHSTFSASSSSHTSGATAACPSGAVSGGGFAANQNSSVFTMLANGNGWQAYVNPSSTTINVYAECVSFS